MKKWGWVIILAVFLGIAGSVKADDCDNAASLTDTNVIISCMNKLQGISDAISKANTNNLQELKGLQNQIAALQYQIKNMDNQLTGLTADIFEREVKIGVKQALLSAKVRQDYIRKSDQPILAIMFSATTAATAFKDIAYREKLARQDRGIILEISSEVNDLSSQSANLKTQKARLAALKISVDKQATWLAGEVDKANKYVADLGGKISALSARQQELLAERTGTYATSVGDVPLADDPNARPSYNPGFSPAFAVFSFGVPHFKGMSQYGAFGRAKAGQSADDILHAYYGGIEIKKDYATGINITVQGYGTVDIETYVKRIYEMPGSWGDEGGFEALKAQAVAARSYALAYTNNGAGSICATESCQVYKPANKGGKWDEAVDATRGWVLVTGGRPFSAWYASTSGGYQQPYTANGYTTPGFWDTTSDWTHWADGAWEVKGGSPWFYKGWYRARDGRSCGRNHPWLTMEEFSDMINAAIVVANNGDTSGIFPEDVRSCWGGQDNPWSKSRLAEEADKFGGRVTNITGVTVKHGSDGYTNQVTFQTNRGEVTISGGNFDRAYNLRAPGALSLKGNLFNIEKK